MLKLLVVSFCAYAVWCFAQSLATPSLAEELGFRFVTPKFELTKAYLKPKFEISRSAIETPDSDERGEVVSEVNATWDQIESELAIHGPANLKLLREPADPERIAQVEKRLGYELPVDLKASLLRHNGSTGPFCVFEQLTIDDILARHCEDAFDFATDPGYLSHEEGDWEPGTLIVGLKNWNLGIDCETGKAIIISSRSCSLEHSDSFLGFLNAVLGRIESGQFHKYGSGDRIEMDDFGR